MLCGERENEKDYLRKVRMEKRKRKKKDSASRSKVEVRRKEGPTNFVLVTKPNDKRDKS